MTKNYKILLLDAKALLYRAHFALIRSPRFNKEGVNTSALFGFTNTLLNLCQKQEPTHMIVALDPQGPTWRSKVYTEYKAQRQAQPEDIATAVAYLPKLLDAFQIPMIEQEGYEADDVIGTLAHQAAAQGMRVYMVTPDKDYAQLLQDNVFWYKPGVGSKSDVILDQADVLKTWGIQDARQVQDILGLWGDSSDNIPGVPGVGQKTAQKLIATFGSIESILEHREKLNSKQKALFDMYGEQALLSKKLATIITDVPLDFSLEEARYQGIHTQKIKALFSELDFRTLAKRLLSPVKQDTQLGLFQPSISEEQERDTIDAFQTLSTTPHQYLVVDTLKACKKLVYILSEKKCFAFDTETTGLQPRHADILGISIAYQSHQAYYIPFAPHSSLDQTEVFNLLQPLFANASIEKIGQNLKYDLHVLARYGIHVQGPFFDTMVAHHLISPEGRHNLNTMAETHLHYQPIPIEQLIGSRGATQRKMTDISLDILTDYACEDADITFQLYQKFSTQLNENNLSTLFHTIEMPLLPVLVSMERHGVAIDVEALERSSLLLQKEINQLTDDIHTLAGATFNIDSPKQLGEILFDRLHIVDNPTKTKTGQYATNESILSKLSNKHPIVSKVQSYRELKKLKSTYIDALPDLMDPIDGRVHTSYQQSTVSTGRLSSTLPNLQNIPIRTEKGRTIREAFVPSLKQGYILSADYSQIELRIMAHLSADQNLIKTFEAGEDIHRATAAQLFNVTPKNVTDAQRRKAKMTNFSIIYGITPFGLSQRLEVSRDEAKEIIENYFRTFPAVKNYIDTSIAKAREQGWVSTLLGRRRYLPDINSRNATVRGFAERNAINMPIQGTQAEMIKKAMVAIHQWLQQANLHTRMIMQVHDELVFDVHPDELSTLKQHIPALMEQALPLSVPIVVDIGTGKSWLEAH